MCLAKSVWLWAWLKVWKPFSPFFPKESMGRMNPNHISYAKDRKLKPFFRTKRSSYLWRVFTWPVCPSFILILEKSTPLMPILRTNCCPWTSSPWAPTIPVEIPNPALSPRTVLATLPPAMALTGWGSSVVDRVWVFTSPNICSSSSLATYKDIGIKSQLWTLNFESHKYQFGAQSKQPFHIWYRKGKNKNLLTKLKGLVGPHELPLFVIFGATVQTVNIVHFSILLQPLHDAVSSSTSIFHMFRFSVSHVS